MDERSDQIVEHIERQRSTLGRNLEELQNRIKSTTDIRVQFDRHPLTMLGVAMGGGMLLGAMVGGRRGSDYRWDSSSSSSGWRSTTGLTGSSSSSSPNSSQPSRFYGDYSSGSRQTSKAMQTFSHLKTALFAYAATQAKDYLNQMLPGFTHHYDEAASDYQQDQNRNRGAFGGSEHRGQYGSWSEGQQGGQNWRQNEGQQHSGQQNPEQRYGNINDRGADTRHQDPAGRQSGTVQQQSNIKHEPTPAV